MGDSPIAVATFESVEISPAEFLEVLTLFVAAAVPCQNLGLDLGRGGGREDDVGRVAEMRGRHRVAAQLRGREAGELDAEPDEGAMVIGGIGVVNGCHQFGVTTVDSSAVIEQASLDGGDGVTSLVGAQWSVGLGNGGHPRQSSARTSQLSPGKFPDEPVH